MAKKAVATTTEKPKAVKSGAFGCDVKAEDLASALARIRAITNRSKFKTLPAVACVHLELRDAGGETILATGTDLDQALQIPVPVAMEQPGVVVVNANRLWMIAKALGTETLKLALKATESKVGGLTEIRHVLQVRAGKVRYELAILPPEEFPQLPEMPEGRLVVQVDREALADALRRVRPAISVDDSRPFLQGVYWEAEGETLTLTATDGARLASQRVPLLERVKKGSWLIPADACGIIQELAKSGSGAEGPLTLSGDARMVQAAVDQTRFWTKQLEGQFPQYQSVVDLALKDSETQVPTPVVPLREALTLAGLVGDRGQSIARLSFTKHGLTVRVSDPDSGTAEVDVALKWPAGKLTTGFKARYLLDYLDSAPEADVELKVSGDPHRPLVFLEARGVYVAMPMRLDALPEPAAAAPPVVTEPTVPTVIAVGEGAAS